MPNSGEGSSNQLSREMERITINSGNIQIEKLLGNSNYQTWSFSMKTQLEFEELWDCIEENDIIDAKKDRRARCRIVLSLDKQLFVHIRTETTAKGVWKHLQLLFQDTGLDRRISLLQKLCSINLEECSNVEDYVGQITSTSLELGEIGFVVSDLWLGSLLLKGLPSDYKPMIMSLSCCAVAPSADSIKVKILQDVKMPTNNSALIATKKPFYGKHNSRRFTKENKNPEGKELREKIRCYNCEGIGHISSVCPSVKKETSDLLYEKTFISKVGSGIDDGWLIDSGASCHMVNDMKPLLKLKACSEEVMIADGGKLKAIGRGDCPIVAKGGRYLTIQNALCVPELATNLLSINELVKSGKTIFFDKFGCQILNNDGSVIATANRRDGSYHLDLVERTDAENCCLAKQRDDTRLWHRRFGHLNFGDLCKLKNDLVTGVIFSGKFDKCAECVLGKAHRKPFPSRESCSSKILELIHTDVCGPMQVKSFKGDLYFVTFIDDFSKKVYLYFLKQKNEVFETFKRFKTLVENQTGEKIKQIRSDNGTEYDNGQMNKICDEYGIVHQHSLPYTPEQNGVAERFNRTLVEKARCMLADSKLSKKFWAEAINTSCYLANISPHSGLSCTPEELWSKRKPSVRHLKVFGCTAYIHIPKEKRRKLDMKAEKAIFVGYSSKSKGYRLMTSNRKIVESRDVEFFEDVFEDFLSSDSRVTSFNETEFYSCTIEKSKHPVDAIQEEANNVVDLEFENIQNGISDSENSIVEDHFVSFNESTNTSENEEDEDTIIEPLALRRSKRLQEKRCTNSSMVAINSLDLEEPKSYEEALSGPHSELWQKAISDEYDSLLQNGTWKDVDMPHGKKLLKCKWVFKIKLDQNGNVSKHKARLVAKGYCQQKGIDYNETFSPVIRYESLRLLISLAAKMNLQVEQMDAITAFLQGDLDEDIYIEAPKGYQVPNGKVLKLQKSLYGLKQSPRMWNKKLTDEFKKIGLVQSKYDPCIYHQYKEGKIMLVALYVDDILFFSNDPTMMREVKDKLKSTFLMKDLGEASLFLGIHLEKDENGFYINQERYIKNLLEKYNMSECKPISTPMDVNEKLTKEMCPKTEKEKDEMKSIPYLELVGSLLFLANVSRPDISYSVSYLSRFSVNPGKKHWVAAKRILRYLKGTLDWRLTFSNKINDQIEGYCDADYANDTEERKSVSGYIFLLTGGSISWRSKKQATIALSTTEAEYVSLSACCQESMWLHGLYKEIIPEVEDESKIFCDNQGALYLAKNQMYSSRTKHIDVKHHFIRDLAEKGLIKLQYLRSEDMLADILTKALPGPRLHVLCKQLGLKSRGDVE